MYSFVTLALCLFKHITNLVHSFRVRVLTSFVSCKLVAQARTQRTNNERTMFSSVFRTTGGHASRELADVVGLVRPLNTQMTRSALVVDFPTRLVCRCAAGLYGWDDCDCVDDLPGDSSVLYDEQHDSRGYPVRRTVSEWYGQDVVLYSKKYDPIHSVTTTMRSCNPLDCFTREEYLLLEIHGMEENLLAQTTSREILEEQQRRFEVACMSLLNRESETEDTGPSTMVMNSYREQNEQKEGELEFPEPVDTTARGKKLKVFAGAVLSSTRTTMNSIRLVPTPP